MKTALSALTVERPRTLKDALKRLEGSLAGGRLTPMAGGTDLFVYLNAGTQEGTRFLDLSLLGELRGIRVTGKGGARIGALTTFAEIGAHAGIRRAFPALIAASRVVGAVQIQNRGTLGGNIANASPAGDSLPVLLAHDAIVHVAGVAGARAIAFGELYAGYRRLALAPGELIVAIELPPAPGRAKTFFRKVGTRAAQSISKVVFAGVLHTTRGGTVDHARLAWGSVAATPVRAHAAEAALLGATVSAATSEAAVAALAGDFTPIDDIRSDREYREQVARALLGQFLRLAHAGFARS